MSVFELDAETLAKATSPIERARLKAYLTKTQNGMKHVVEPYLKDEYKCHPKDRVKCQVCGKVYTRSGSAKHKKSQQHKIYEDINNKLLKAILGNDE